MIDETKITWEAFRDFAASKPRDETYKYVDNENCPVGQFIKHLFPNVTPNVTALGRFRLHNAHNDITHPVTTRIALLANDFLETWGALQDRMRMSDADRL